MPKTYFVYATWFHSGGPDKMPGTIVIYDTYIELRLLVKIRCEWKEIVMALANVMLDNSN